MLSRQLQRLNVSKVIASLGSPILYMEPFSIKKKDLDRISVGSLIRLGRRRPALYIGVDGSVVAGAELVLDGDREVLLVTPSPEESFVSDSGSPKKEVVEIKITTISRSDIVRGRSIVFDWPLRESMILYRRGRYFALSELLYCEGEWYLRITETVS